MSHHALQRALVVALHDPGFAAALAEDPASALDGFDLEPGEVAQLRAIDPRALAIDRLRGRRVLKAIGDELRGSLAIALAEVRRFGFADAFFSSPWFRQAIARDRPLVLALADYLAAALERGELASPHLAGVLAIERARAECRRDRPGAPPPGLSLAPGVRLIATDASALEALQAAERHLFELSLSPHLALCEDRPALVLGQPGGRPLHLAIRAGDGDVGLDEVPGPFFRSVGALAARAPLRRDQVAAALAAVGLRVADPDRLVDDLIADGYLVEG